VIPIDTDVWIDRLAPIARELGLAGKAY